MSTQAAAVPTKAEATAAARGYRETQPQIDAMKDVFKANTAQKKILGAYMLAHDLPVFKGVELKVIKKNGWNWPKLAELGPEFKAMYDEKHFSLAKRAKPGRQAVSLL